MAQNQFSKGYREGMQDIMDIITRGGFEVKSDSATLAEVCDWVLNNGAVRDTALDADAKVAREKEARNLALFGPVPKR
jgi:hypothetical protein